ncbi:unnamed protein product [Danaus chrysippus]|uniref:(African queen) hypothetical protein n=1 Tax=Danaus chrysippus TaxID=151541 RepID=A0A8J2MFE4_9NEOP|nr:unnamed protein product [Danaus chrysippus]
MEPLLRELVEKPSVAPTRLSPETVLAEYHQEGWRGEEVSCFVSQASFLACEVTERKGLPPALSPPSTSEG